MCLVNKLVTTPCLQNAPGVQGIGYVAPAEDFNAWPAYLGTTGAGDTVKLSGNFDFTGAGTGKGYWRQFPILIEKGKYNAKVVGGIGSKSFEETFTFYIPGVDAAQLEWVKQMANVPAVWLCPDKNGIIHVIGTKSDPAYIQDADADSGAAASDSRGISFVIRAISASPTVYTGTINTTPLP